MGKKKSFERLYLREKNVKGLVFKRKTYHKVQFLKEKLVKDKEPVFKRETCIGSSF